MFRNIYILLIILAALVVSGGARADTELVANGGFETDSFVPDWTAGGGTFIDNANPNSGFYDAGLPDGGTLSQNLDTSIAGQTYTLSFALLDEAGDSNDTFTVTFGGFSMPITGNQAPPFGALPSGDTAFSFAIDSSAITAPLTALNFSVISENGQAFNLDDVSVLAAGGSTPVPEPSTLTLLVGALAAGGWLVGRKGAVPLRNLSGR